MDKLEITIDPCSSMVGPAQVRIAVPTANDLSSFNKIEHLIDENIIPSNKLISKMDHANHTIVVWSFNGDIQNLINMFDQKGLEYTMR